MCTSSYVLFQDPWDKEVANYSDEYWEKINLIFSLKKWLFKQWYVTDKIGYRACVATKFEAVGDPSCFLVVISKETGTRSTGGYCHVLISLCCVKDKEHKESRPLAASRRRGPHRPAPTCCFQTGLQPNGAAWSWGLSILLFGKVPSKGKIGILRGREESRGGEKNFPCCSWVRANSGSGFFLFESHSGSGLSNGTL
jgi:hypothetical protein